ncbi:retrovirus-related pol polyprotein from transposon TNT 1-94 [Tanacetum coccineum]
MDKLITNVSEKTYAYDVIHAENQNLLITISELKTRLANVEKDLLSTKSRTPKSYDSTYVVRKTKFSKESTDKSKSLDTTYVVSKPNNDVRSTKKLTIEADEFIQEASDDFDGSLEFVSYNPPSDEEIESSTAALEPSNVQNFHQVQPLTHIWTKDHPLDQVIGDPSKPVMTRQKLQTDSEVCMYALTVSTIEPKNIKEAMADHSWIKSMQDELNQFERLQVWELVPRPEGNNIIALKWLWKNKCDAKNIVVRNYNTPKFRTTQRNTALGCYFIVYKHKSRKTTSKETF